MLFLIFILTLIFMPLLIPIIKFIISVILYIKDIAEHRKYLKQFENSDEQYGTGALPVPKKNKIAGGVVTILALALFVGGPLLVSIKNDSSKETAEVSTSDTEKYITDISASEQTTSQILYTDESEDDTVPSYIKSGEGYSFSVAGGWKLLDAGENYDFDILLNIPYTPMGIISVQIKHFYLSEVSLDGKRPNFETYVNYDYEISKMLYSLSEEDICFSDSVKESRKIGDSLAYEYYIDNKADIVSLDLSKAEYGNDEYGNVIITNMDSLSTITYSNVFCRSKYYFVENGDEIIELIVTYTIANEDKCAWYIDYFLDEITLEKQIM